MNWLRNLFGGISPTIPPVKLTGHKHLLRSVAVSPDGRRILTGSLDDTAKVWDAASGANVLTLAGHSSTLTAVPPVGHERVFAVWSYEPLRVGRESLLGIANSGPGIASEEHRSTRDMKRVGSLVGELRPDRWQTTVPEIQHSPR